MKFTDIVFDLDGTLWDPTEVSYHAWEKALIEFELDPSLVSKTSLQAAFGHLTEEFVAIVIPHIPFEQAVLIAQKAYELEIPIIGSKVGVIYEGLEETLALLSSSANLYICSNCQSHYIESFLETYELDHFIKDTICSGDTLLNKSENLSLLMKRNRMKETLFVGDMESDLIASKENNIPYMHARYGFGKVKEYRWAIDSLREIAPLLKLK